MVRFDINYKNDPMTDILGAAMLDYINGKYSEDIITESSISEADEMPVPYLFRSYDEMPLIEQQALNLCKGTILDIGCGAGSHSLYLQEQRKLAVHAIDISPGAIQTALHRGVKNATQQNYKEITKTYDTLLLLMNGIGICGKAAQLSVFLTHLKGLLNPNGQILLDSSDLSYMFDRTYDGGILVPAANYYGEITFTMSYKGCTSDVFSWLYLDYNSLKQAAHANGLYCELIQEGTHYDFLARLSII